MDSTQYERSTRVGRGMNIMDTVSGRIESGEGDAYVQITDPGIERKEKCIHQEDNDSNNAVIMTCTSIDSCRSKEESLPPYRSNEYTNEIMRHSSNRLLHRKKKCRFIKKSGHCNVSHAHLSDKPQRFMADIFTTCVDLRWRWNLLLFSTAFIIRLFFGLLYWLIAHVHGDFVEGGNETACINNLEASAPFTSAFLFSLETQTTIGYGLRVVTEECASAIIIVVLQSVFGCVIDAFMIGLIMAKISRPKKRAETLLFSKKACVNVRDGQMCLMVRVGNLRKSHLVEATIRMQYIYSRTTLEGEFIPLEQIDLHLDLKNDSDRLFLVTPQTICHPIDADSPLYNMNKESLKDADFEIILILEGMVEATGMTTQARASYLPGEMLWGHRFENVITFTQSNGYNVNFKKFDNTYETVGTPTCSPAELMIPRIMIPNGSTEDTKIRSATSSIKRIREDHSISDGRDSGYTPVEEEDRPSTESTKTLSSISSTGSRFSMTSDPKHKVWSRRKKDDASTENKVEDSVFLPTSDDDFTEKQINQTQNEKNITMTNSSQILTEKNVANGVHASNHITPKVAAVKENRVDEQNVIAPKTVFQVVPVKESDETALLLDSLPACKATPVIQVLDEQPRITDSPV
uniref:inward rectifier potassium channel 2-like isoform X2 n=1 Tax=Styela clava TaxID=7725 RepID=UPI00193A9E37|nr:inward rectifier potassium channel 2-like isoform X2 [Styela clava]